MSVQEELKGIKKILNEVNKKLDILTENREIPASMRLSERSLKDFLLEEPNLYTVKDLKVMLPQVSSLD